MSYPYPHPYYASLVCCISTSTGTDDALNSGVSKVVLNKRLKKYSFAPAVSARVGALLGFLIQKCLTSLTAFFQVLSSPVVIFPSKAL